MIQNCPFFLSFEGVLLVPMCFFPEVGWFAILESPPMNTFFFPWLRMCREYETINHKHKVIIIGCLYNVFLLALTGGRLSSLYALNLRFEQPTCDCTKVNRLCFASWSYGTYHPATRTNKHQLNWVMSDNHPQKRLQITGTSVGVVFVQGDVLLSTMDSSLLNHHLRNMFG